MSKSPYKFLDSYSKEDRDIFFGREKETDELYSRVFETKILVVYGTSGTGKSSLINCGLANKFNDSDWLPVGVRRGSNINISLSEALQKQSFTDTAREKQDQKPVKQPSITKLIQSIYLDHFKPVYIIFDQFEELFIFGTAEEKDELIRSVKKIIDSELQCRFIFSVREEYLAGLTEFERIIPTFLSNRIRIEKMTRQNAVRVIEGPCQKSGIVVDPLFPEKLLEKLNPENPEVELTYLQVYLDRIYRIAAKEGDAEHFTVSMLDAAGEVKDLLGTFLEEQISQLDDPESGLVILKSFVSVRGTKNQITEDEVLDYSKTFGHDPGREKTRDLIQKFVKLRILRDKDESGRYELRHDSLATKIFEKITLVEKELLEIRVFLDNAFTSFERRGLYLTNADLSYIAPYEDKLFLSERMQRFISQSKSYVHRAKRRRQNAFASVAVIIIAILTFFTIWAFRERANALGQRNVAESERQYALKAKQRADSVTVVATVAKNVALEKEQIAIQSQKQSEEAKKEALAQREIALTQKQIAEKLSVEANEQARIANSERLTAQRERAKAVAAESKARRLSFLSVAKKLALKAANLDKDPQLMGLLAVQAYKFNRDNGGSPNEPDIYEALYKALTVLDSSKHQLFTGSENEIISIAEREGALLSADLDGKIKIWSYEGIATVSNEYSVPGPVDLIRISPAGTYILYGNSISGAFVKCLKDGKPSVYSIGLADNFPRVIAFSADESLMATGGRDSLINIWQLNATEVRKLYSIKTEGPVRLLEFCGKDTIASVFTVRSGEMDIHTIQWNLVAGRQVSSISQKLDVPLCLKYNQSEKYLYAGFSSGAIEVYGFRSGVFNQSRMSVESRAIDQIAFNSDGTILGLTCWDRSIKFYRKDRYFQVIDHAGGNALFRGSEGRSRFLFFDSADRMISAMADKSIRIWETSPEKLSNQVCSLLTRNLTETEWLIHIGDEVPYERTCTNPTNRGAVK